VAILCDGFYDAYEAKEAKKTSPCFYVRLLVFDKMRVVNGTVARGGAFLPELAWEGLTQGVYLTGDVMLDCFLHFSKEAEKRSGILDDLGIEQNNYLLATVHRASNTDTKENLQEICKAFIELAKEIELVFPVHPRTEKYLKQYGLYQALKNTPNIHLIKPVGYLEMLVLTKNAGKTLTDSGGLQKEAYFAKVPCITLDTVSAWPETVENGWKMGGIWWLGQMEKEQRILIHSIYTGRESYRQRDPLSRIKSSRICLVMVRQQKRYAICWLVNDSKWCMVILISPHYRVRQYLTKVGWNPVPLRGEGLFSPSLLLSIFVTFICFLNFNG
jgi:hypothetical protein